MSATEKLVAEWGIEAVNLRDVGREADQRNNSVVQYHFGTKDVLVDAVIESRFPALDARYRAQLGDLQHSDRSGDPGVLASLLIDPLLQLAESVADRCSLGFMAALLTAPHWRPVLMERADVQALFAALVDALASSGVPRSTAASRLRLAWLMAVVSLAASTPDDLAVLRVDLLDAVCGLLGAGTPRKTGSGRR